MQLNFSVESTINIPGMQAKILKAVQQSLKDVVIAVAKDAIENSPVSPEWPSISKVNRPPTGNNKRSIMYQIGSAAPVQPNKGKVVNQTSTDPGPLGDLEGAVYGTSGYSGYLEVGTALLPARPYLFPAVTERFTQSEMAGRIKANLGE